ncbi:MAG TPA: ferritin-like protein [Thermoanaerobaculia bacterium]|nr:ferritin-like protein [Thermoanaerobaculia bacterium]
MLTVRREMIEGVRQAARKEDLYPYLQSAVELEHATIPPYLTAMFSLKAGTNEEIRRLIQSIVVEEMLHMTISSNILVAIGGSPQINTPVFIPKYPGPLPRGIGGPDFIVPIERFSLQLVHDIFMVIEEPENPIPIKTFMVGEEEYSTIGAFYQAIQEKIVELGNGIFVPGSEKRQVQKWFGYEHLFPITDVAGAVKAIEVVVIEGEGTSTDPFQSPGDPAHFYKFGEIYHGKRIIPTPDGGYAYAGAPVPFDASGVYPIRPNAHIDDYAPDTQARVRVERYAYSYSSLLNALHKSFNGEPDNIDVAIGLMYELKVQAVSLMSTELGDGSGMTAGPSYQYVNVQGGMGPAAD